MDAWCTSLQPQNRASMTSVLVTSFSLKNRLTRPARIASPRSAVNAARRLGLRRG